VDKFPQKGESVVGHKFIMGNGGKGASAGVMASLMGAQVRMVGQVGEDIFADSCLEMLQKCGLNTDYVARTSHATTAIAVITVDSKGFYVRPCV
jgi:ribokinase